MFYVKNYVQRVVPFWDEEKFCRVGEVPDDNTTRLMRFSCWIPEVTNTHPQYVILIALPRQQWFLEHASVLCFNYRSYILSNTTR
jgi:hypothetical protein